MQPIHVTLPGENEKKCQVVFRSRVKCIGSIKLGSVQGSIKLSCYDVAITLTKGPISKCNDAEKKRVLVSFKKHCPLLNSQAER